MGTASETAHEVFNGVANYVGYLRDRWADEREYEDFKDYKRAISTKISAIAPNCIVTDMKKRPFQVEFVVSHADRRLNEMWLIAAKGNQLTLARYK